MYPWGFCDQCARYGRSCKLIDGKCSMVIKDETSKDVELKASVRLDAYKIIDDAVDRAVRYGYRRSYKHVENPTEHQMIEEIHRAVMNELCEILKFDE